MSSGKWLLAVVAAVLIAGTALGGIALATPPSGQVSQILGRGTTNEAVKYTVPKVVTVTVKYRVRVHGRYVIRKKRVKRTIDVPLVRCVLPTDVVNAADRWPVSERAVRPAGVVVLEPVWQRSRPLAV